LYDLATCRLGHTHSDPTNDSDPIRSIGILMDGEANGSGSKKMNLYKKKSPSREGGRFTPKY